MESQTSIRVVKSQGIGRKGRICHQGTKVEEKEFRNIGEEKEKRHRIGKKEKERKKRAIE